MKFLIFLLFFISSLALAGTTSDSYSGVPIQIGPGSTVFRAADFDKGGEGIAYHDNTSGNCTLGTPGCPANGGVYRTLEDVDIYGCGNATQANYCITSTDTGEWLQYTIQVQDIGSYTIELLVAIGTGCPDCLTAAYHVEVDGKAYRSNLLMPLTTDWSTFDWRGKSELIPMVPGIHKLKIVIDQHWFGWDSIRITKAGWIDWIYTPVWRTVQ